MHPPVRISNGAPAKACECKILWGRGEISVLVTAVLLARLPDKRLTFRRGASDRNRTNDTGIFSPLLYRLSYRGISGAIIPAPSRAILANFGAPAKACEARFCGEEEKVWRSSRQSCLQDRPMNCRTFDEATRIGLEPTTPSVTGWCSNQLSYRAIWWKLTGSNR